MTPSMKQKTDEQQGTLALMVLNAGVFFREIKDENSLQLRPSSSQASQSHSPLRVRAATDVGVPTR